MITLIIGTEKESLEKAREVVEGKSVFVMYNADKILLTGKKEIEKRDVLCIKNLDDKLLFEEIVEILELLKKHKIETIAITYRDDMIEAYEEDEDVNIIDLRGE